MRNKAAAAAAAVAHKMQITHTSGETCKETHGRSSGGPKRRSVTHSLRSKGLYLLFFSSHQAKEYE